MTLLNYLNLAEIFFGWQYITVVPPYISCIFVLFFCVSSIIKVLLVEEIRVPEENYSPIASHWPTSWGIDCTLPCAEIKLTTFSGLGFGLWCLMPFSTKFQLYHGSQFYWWRKPEYPAVNSQFKTLPVGFTCYLISNKQSNQ